MQLFIKLIKPRRGLWFNADLESWLEKHKEKKDKIKPINETTIQVLNSPIIIGKYDEDKENINLDIDFGTIQTFRQISGRHAEIFKKIEGKEEKWYIIDLRSKYGTSVIRNENIIEVRNEVKLENHDKIFLGKKDSKYEFNATLQIEIVNNTNIVEAIKRLLRIKYFHLLKELITRAGK